MADINDFARIGSAVGVLPPSTPIKPMVGMNMSDFSDGSPLAPQAMNPAQFAKPTPEEVRQNNIDAARETLMNPQIARRVAAARENGNEIADAPYVKDLEEMSYGDLVETYGKDVADNRWRLTAERNAYRDTKDSERDPIERTVDVAKDVLSGTAGMVGSLGALGVGIINAEAGVRIARGTGVAQEMIRGSQTEDFQERRESFILDNQLNREDSERQYQEDRSVASDESGFSARLSMIGRDVVNNVKQFIEDPAMALSVSAEGLGSLGPSSVVAGGAAKVAGRFAPSLVKPAVGAAVGVTESAGTYSQGVNEIDDMSEEDLRITSPEYNAMREQGASHQEAKIQLANNVGLEAAARQLPFAIAGGTLASRFEAAPLMAGSKAAAVQNIVGQGFEEAYQGATGEVSTNAAVMGSVNDGRSLGDGVGEAIVSGAVGGLGMAGATQGVGLTGEITKDVATAAMKPVNTAVQAVAGVGEKLGEARRVAREATSAVSNAATAERAVEVKNNIVEVATVLAATPEATPETMALSGSLRAVVEMNDDEIAAVPASVADLSIIPDEGDGQPTQPNDRINRLGNMVNAINDPKMDPAKKQDAALYVFEEVMKLRSFALEDLPEQIAALPDTDPIKQKMMNAKEQILAIQSNEGFVNAVVAARETSMDQNVVPEVTPENIVLAQRMSIANPQGVNPDFVDMVLDQREKGEIEMSDEQAKAMKAAGVLTRTLNDTLAEKQKLLDAEAATPAGKAGAAAGKKQKQVSREIQIEGVDLKGPNGQTIKGLSLADFYSDILQSSVTKGPIVNRVGQTVDAESSHKHLRNFAQHMVNKLNAATKSMDTGKGETFSFLSPNGNMLPATHKSAKPGPKIHDALGSKNLARTIYLEALATVQMYNNMISVYGTENGGTLTGKKMELPALDKRLAVGFQLNEKTLSNYARDGSVAEAPSQDTAPIKIPDAQKAQPAEGTKRTKGMKDMLLETDLLERDETNVSEAQRAEAQAKAAIPVTPKPAKVKKRRAPAPKKASTRILKPKGGKRPSSLRDFVTNSGGISSADPMIAEVREMEYRRPGFIRAKGGMQIDLMRSAAAEAGYIDMDSTEADFLALLAQDVQEKSAYSQNDLNEVAEWAAYDEAKAAQFEAEGTTATTVITQPSPPAQPITKPAPPPPPSPNGPTSPTPVENPYDDKNDVAAEGEVTEADLLDDVEQEDMSLIDLAKLGLMKTVGGVSRFARAFKITKASKSMLTDYVDTMDGFSELLNNNESIPEDMKYVIYNLVKENGTKIADLMNEKLKTQTINNDDKSRTIADALVNQPEVADWLRFGATAMMNPEEGTYDKHLLDQAVIAAIHYVLNATQKSYVTSDMLARSFGVNDNMIAPEFVDAMNTGVSEQDAKAELGRLIMEFWGVTTDDSVTMTDTKGLAEVMAAELLEVMAADGTFVVATKVNVPVISDGGVVIDDNRTLNMLVPAQPATLAANEAMKGHLDAIRRVVSPDADPMYFFDKAPKKEQRTQKRNKLSLLSAFEKKVIQNNREIENRVNMPVLDVVTRMGDDMLGRNLGSIDLEAMPHNKNHEKSIRGKNLSNQMSFHNLRSQMGMLEAHAEVTGKAVSEVGVYYDYYMSKVGRLMQVGFGPQANKLAREIFVATRSVLDMTDPNGQGADQFWMTVAQSSGLVKTEKEYRKDSIATASTKMYERYGKSITMMQEFIKSADKMTKAQHDILSSEIGYNSNMKLIHSIIAVAQYENAKIEGGEALSKFQHDLSIEADGKTDGPINAMVHYMSGLFSGTQLALLAKGGLFFNEEGKTLNQHVKADKADLYQVAAIGLGTRLAEQRTELTEASEEAADLNEAFLRVMEAFGEIELKDGTITIGRDIVKNPLTVTVYGSGINGINDKVANFYIDAIYEAMSELAQQQKIQNNPKLTLGDLPRFKNNFRILNDISKVFSIKYFYSQTQDKHFFFKEGSVTNMKAVDFTFNKASRDVFSNNMRVLLVDHLDASIKEMMNDTIETTTLIQKTTQVQGAYVIEMFKAAVDEKMKQRVEEGVLRKGEILSKEDYDGILLSLQEFAPIIENEDQTINVGLAENTSSNYRISRTMSGGFDQEARLSVPTDAGVKAAANLTQNRGDALMVNNIYDGVMRLHKSLAVFDGIELAADMMDAYGLLINEAVEKGWLTNPVMDVNNSFQSFMRIADLDSLQNAETGKILIRTFGDQFTSESKKVRELEQSLGATMKTENKSKAAKDQIKSLQSEIDKIYRSVAVNVKPHVEALAEEMNKVAMSVQARKNTMKRVGFSVDHMASTETPFWSKGETFEGLTGDALADRLNEIYNEELSKLNAEKDAIEKPSTEFSELIKEFAQEIPDTGLMRMDGAQALKMLESKGSTLNADQKKILGAIRKGIQWKMKIIIGSSADIALYQEATGATVTDPQLGQYDAATNTIYMLNQSNETLLHEMVHAATLAKVFDYYNDASAMGEADRDAVKRLEVLMTEFLRLDTKVDGATVNNLTVDVQSQIQGYLNENTAEGKAAALNEFMAWVLTNQNLAQIAQTTTVRNPLALIAKKGLELMRRLLGFQSRDMWSNILFNTKILTDTRRGAVQRKTPVPPASMVLNQVVGGSNPSNVERLSRLIELYNTKVNVMLNGRDPIKADEMRIALVQATDTAETLVAGGFGMTAQERQAFSMVQATMQANMDIDRALLVRMQRLYNAFLASNDYTLFLDVKTSEKDDEHVAAQVKFNALTKMEEINSTKGGISTLLASFVALSQVNEDFRKALTGMEVPKAVEISTESFDELLNSVANSGLALAGMSINEGRDNKNVKEALDKLAVMMGAAEEKAENFVMQKSQRLMDRADAWGANALERLGETMGTFADRKDDTATKVEKALYAGAQAASAMISKRRGEIMGKEVISLLNEGNLWKPLTDVIVEAIGLTDENKAVLLMVDKVKAAVSAVRQTYKETLPKIFQKNLTRNLEEREWSVLYKAMGKTDLAGMEGYKVGTLFSFLIDKSKRDAEITRLESQLGTMADADVAQQYMVKGKELAMFMMTGRIHANQLKNAYAISVLAGQPNMKATHSEQIEKAIDALVSLYAMNEMGKAEQETITDLVNTEAEGLEFMLMYMNSLRKSEGADTMTPEARMNGIKGYIPATSQDGTSLVLADDSMHVKMLEMGYTRLDKYIGMGLSVEGGGTKSYYYSSVAGANTYSQGVMQTVQTSINGVDARSGRNVTGEIAGVIYGAGVARINDKMNQNAGKSFKEGLMPVFDEDGVVVAYERMMSREAIIAMNKNTNLGDMVGAWAGRQNEEKLAIEYNRMLADRVNERYVSDMKNKRGGEYIDLSDPDLEDEVYRTSWSLVPRDMKEYIKETFPDGKFMVRKDMIDNIVGYRNPSISDVFTGESRLDPKTQKVVRGFAEVFLGEKAFEYLVTGEKTIQTAVSIAKQTIVIRSVFVPVVNAMSNALQLLTVGVRPADILKGARATLIEIDGYLKNNQEIVELEAEVLANQDQPFKVKQLNARIRGLRDSNARMGIAGLIEAGAFSTISEGITDVDEALLKGKYVDWVEQAVDKLPEGVKTIGKNLIITKDTALFQGMSRSVQYGDFVAKAILYKHNMERKGMTKDEAVESVFEEFVNFNLLPGRTRTYAESMGLTWFWAFKIRSMKVARRMVLNNPARAFMTTFLMPTVGMDMGFGSVITDNFAAVALDGRIGDSIGYDMLWRSASLNPWINLTS